ncbi:CRISPR-associated helicase Cas3' [Kitasatospora sp. NPDC015120]|uniref:CRISPR-associated helicase Cas3' n=1 Tax=Kitasatospora sp. NPDC015120 TaxID=3364023 RepID=UPI0036F482A9
MEQSLTCPPREDQWGKSHGLLSPYPLPAHLVDTAAMAGELWDSYLSRGQREMIATGFGVTLTHARALVQFWAGLHDVGKACWSHQSLPSGPMPAFLDHPDFAAPAGWMHQDRVGHDRVTHLVTPHLLARYGYDNTSRPSKATAHQIAQILGGHHGVYGRALERAHLTDVCGGDPRACAAPGWLRERQALVELLHTLTGRPAAPAQVAKAGIAIVVTGLVIAADWLASRTAWVKARQAQWRRSDRSHWAAHFERAVKYAPYEIARAELHTPRWKSAETFPDVFPEIEDPYPLQLDLGRLPGLVPAAKGSWERRGGLVLITAPTGDGKTESALYAARILATACGRPGLAVLLPTMATTNAMWERVTEYVESATSNQVKVTLQHSMAWLHPKYAPGEKPSGESVLTHPGGSGRTVPDEWLRGRHRGWLAGITIGTWDQGAIAALPTRFGCMRWLGMSGKTIVIDEAHAYDAYGHALTVRLLEWLGHIGAPVVLLSATLAGSLARRLVQAYRDGAGHPEPTAITPAYPGWLYADGATGTVTASPALETTRRRDLPITTVRARHTHDPHRRNGRAAALLQHLAPLFDPTAAPGSALVVCNTVGDAQATYDLLTVHHGAGRRPRVLLLHARMPEWQREDSTEELKTLLGKKGPRPADPLIVVSTQVAEQSLDIDADLVVSDLAPLAQLLQRAGRCHRHDITGRGTRPSWAASPALTVIVPTGQLPPHAWGSDDRQVYDGALLRRTAEYLNRVPATGMRVPEDVADAIDSVYVDFNGLAELELAEGDDRRRAARDVAHQAAADIRTIPQPRAVTDLYSLTTYEGDEDDLTTRLGADTVRLLPVYTDSDANQWLDPACTETLPGPGDRTDSLTREVVAELVRRTIQAPADYLPASDTATHTPAPWKDTPVARDLRLLPHQLTGPARRWQYHAPTGHRLYVDPDRGLVRRR